MNTWIILLGNISEGYQFIGPFSSFDEASDHADTCNDFAWIATLAEPETNE